MCGAGGGLDRFEEPLAINRLRENFRPRDGEPLFARRITGQKQHLEPWKSFAERAAEPESIDSHAIELREEKIAARMFFRPLLRCRIARHKVAPVLGVVCNHRG